MAAAMITRFFIIYCPSRVGTKKPFQVTAGSINSGIKVIAMCIKSMGMTMRSNPRNTNKIPIRHSNIPNRIIKLPNDIKLMVCSKSFCTNGLAGDKSRTFRRPNQKKITNKPNRAIGTETLLKKCMSSISIFRSDM